MAHIFAQQTQGNILQAAREESGSVLLDKMKTKFKRQCVSQSSATFFSFSRAQHLQKILRKRIYDQIELANMVCLGEKEARKKQTACHHLNY